MFNAERIKDETTDHNEKKLLEREVSRRII